MILSPYLVTGDSVARLIEDDFLYEIHNGFLMLIKVVRENIDQFLVCTDSFAIGQ